MVRGWMGAGEYILTLITIAKTDVIMGVVHNNIFTED